MRQEIKLQELWAEAGEMKTQTQGVALQRYQNLRGEWAEPLTGPLGTSQSASLHPHILPHPSTLLRARTFSSRTFRGPVNMEPVSE